MSLKPSILAPALALSACSPVCPQVTPAPMPVVVVLPGPVHAQNMSETSPVHRSSIRKKTANPLDPVIKEQQRLWDCISGVDKYLFLDCAEQMAASANCYDEKVGALISRSQKIPQCRDARLARKENYIPDKMEKVLAAEEKCLDEILRSNPSALNEFSSCYSEELTCLRGIVEAGPIVCSAAEEEAYLYVKP